MKLGTHMPGGERRKPIDIEVCRTKVKVITSKIEQKVDTFLVSARYLENESNRIYVNLDTQALCIHMFATRLSHLRCVTDFHFSFYLDLFCCIFIFHLFGKKHYK